MLPYAAYLRVYEPLDAFAEPYRSAWARYADSADRPRRATALDAEHAAAMRRLVAVPPEVAPARESGHAYVRRTADVTYICPWQIRLRCWLAFSRFRAWLPPGLGDAFMPRVVADQVESDFERWKRRSATLLPYILSSNWYVPLAWFVAFAPAERRLLLGPQAAAEPVAERTAPASQGERGNQPESGGAAPTTAPPARALLYVTSMTQARRRVAKAIGTVRGAGDGTGSEVGLEAGVVATLGRWLEEFHPHALVELDYGGLVHLVDDEALTSDESVAEVAAVLDGMRRDRAVALAMYERVQARWRSVRALEKAN